MKTVYLVTSNKNKVKEFKFVLGPEIIVKWIEMDYPEIRSDDLGEIASTAAFSISRRLKKTIVVEDSGLFVEALKGFPGSLTKTITKKIGNKGIITLMRGKKKRSARFKSAISMCSPRGNPKVFIGEEKGTISTKISGKGWGQDSIFVPLGKKRTYGKSKRGVALFRERALLKMKQVMTNAGKTTRRGSSAK